MDTDFSDWLLEQLATRGWRQADLARAARVKRQVISAYINRRTRHPDPEILAKIAAGLKLPPEIVYRAAGIRIPATKNSEKREATHFAVDNIAEEDLDLALKMLQAICKHDPPEPGASQSKAPTTKSRKTPARSVLKDDVEK